MSVQQSAIHDLEKREAKLLEKLSTTQKKHDEAFNRLKQEAEEAAMGVHTRVISRQRDGTTETNGLQSTKAGSPSK